MKSRLFLVCLVLVFFVQVGVAKNRITVAVIGHKPPRVEADAAGQDIAEKMIKFWQREFAQVLPDRPDLIVVPEACDRPRGLSREQQFAYYRVRGTKVRDYFASVARENRCYVVYPAVRRMEDGSWRNSSVLLDRQGRIAGIYNKNHPTIGEMDAGIRCGKEITVVQCDFGRVGFAICFDLNFDEIRLQYKKARPDIILFSSVYHGGLMQSYWAYSTRSFFVGAVANTPSTIINPLGEIVASSTNYFDFAVASINLDSRLVHLDYNWDKLRAMKKKYGPRVTISDPGYLGAVLISSEHDSLSIEDMIREFDIEQLDAYFTRSLQYRLKPGNME